jgi:hypothetical protein
LRSADVNVTQLVMHGTVKPDGTLELEGKTNLPPGRVKVTLNVIPEAAQTKEDVWTVLERIWEERKVLGMPARTREEIDAEINALRDELEERMDQLQAIQDEAARAREN